MIKYLCDNRNNRNAVDKIHEESNTVMDNNIFIHIHFATFINHVI